MIQVFHWDLMSIADMIPTHFVNYFLANGIVFDNEKFGSDSKPASEVVSKITEKALSLLDTLVWERGSCPALSSKMGSVLAAGAIHAARSEHLPRDTWPKELEILTRCKLKKVEEVSLLLRKLHLA